MAWSWLDSAALVTVAVLAWVFVRGMKGGQR